MTLVATKCKCKSRIKIIKGLSLSNTGSSTKTLHPSIHTLTSEDTMRGTNLLYKSVLLKDIKPGGTVDPVHWTLSGQTSWATATPVYCHHGHA